MIHATLALLSETLVIVIIAKLTFFIVMPGLSDSLCLIRFCNRLSMRISFGLLYKTWRTDILTQRRALSRLLLKEFELGLRKLITHTKSEVYTVKVNERFYKRLSKKFKNDDRVLFKEIELESKTQRLEKFFTIGPVQYFKYKNNPEFKKYFYQEESMLAVMICIKKAPTAI